jgi:hypothetical protein
MPAEDFALFLGKQRLQLLLEEFEAAREAYADECERMSNGTVYKISYPRGFTPPPPPPPLPPVRSREPEDFANLECSMSNDQAHSNRNSVIVCARRYIIARDFNEFRDGHWQTLWKLTHGGSL